MSHDDVTKGLPPLESISRNTETMPAWAVEGKKVALVRGRGNVELVPVKRVTAKFVTLDHGQYETKYSLSRGLEASGERSAWSSRSFLTDPDTELAKLHLEAARVDTLSYKAQAAGTAFAKDRNPETGVAVVDTMNTYLAAWNNLAHLKSTYQQGITA